MNVWKEIEVEKEIERMVSFIKSYVQTEDEVVVSVSGGMDSDIVARLCCKSVGNHRVRLFIVIQSDMEEKFLLNARNLAKELGVTLAEIHLEDQNVALMKALEEAQRHKIFDTDMMLELAKAKCSVRSAVISSYQDKGFLIAGTTNRTEKELGFFLTFGDNIAHFKPISHLYKSELKEVAKILGTAEEVINQEPSAGFWKGQTDLEDIAYWIVNDGPIVYPRRFTEEEQLRVQDIMAFLKQEKIDCVLAMYGKGESVDNIVGQVCLPKDVVEGLMHIVDKAKLLKSRPIMVELDRNEE